MNRLYAVLIVGVVLGASHWGAYRSGKGACEADHRQAVAEERTRDAGQVLAITKSDVAREIRYVTKEVHIKESVDDCLDRPMPDDVLNVLGMQSRDSGTARPRTAQSLPTPGT